ncbi:MAG: hypothetical protein NZM44_06635 [Candidatus Calescibacterium sp.]|nr:hypothetical protein [Candidatus Calescibacterium sp.]
MFLFSCNFTAASRYTSKSPPSNEVKTENVTISSKSKILKSNSVLILLNNYA